MNAFRRLYLLLVCLFLSGPAFADNCSILKKKFLIDNQFSEADLEKLKAEVEVEHALCTKNLLGIMLYRGIYFERDIEKAEQIFFDLSSKGYPEASLNFALLMSRRTDQNPSNVIVLLLGIYKTYASDKRNSHLASKARDIARAYLEKLPDISSQCNQLEQQACSEEFAKLSDADIKILSGTFEYVLRDMQAVVAVNSVKETRAAKERVETFITLFSIGLMAYKAGILASNSGAVDTPYSSSPAYLIEQNQNPWLNGNPLNLNLYQWPIP